MTIKDFTIALEYLTAYANYISVAESSLKECEHYRLADMIEADIQRAKKDVKVFLRKLSDVTDV